MTLIGHLFALRKHVALTTVLLAAGFLPRAAYAQALNPSPSTAETPAPSQPAGPAVKRIVVQGTQRIEAGTVLSYLSIREGDPYDEQVVDRSLKTLFATGLFADVKMNWDGSTLTVNVVENPIINQIVFEGEDKVSEKDLTKEVQLKPRTVFTRNKVQSDVQRIIELYRRNGKFAAKEAFALVRRFARC